MSNEKKVIRDSIRQVQKIYEQVSILIKTADGLMGEHHWEPEKKTPVIFGSSTAHYLPRQWLPSILKRAYVNNKVNNSKLLMGIVLDHKMIEEPLIIGTKMYVAEGSKEFPDTTNYDYSFWFLEKVGADLTNEMVVIDEPLVIREKEKRDDLGPIMAFATPLLEIKNSEQLQEKFVDRLLALSQ